MKCEKSLIEYQNNYLDYFLLKVLLNNFYRKIIVLYLGFYIYLKKVYYI